MKQLQVAVDIYDEIHHTGEFPDEQYLMEMMRWIRQLGATTVDWIVDDMWSLYDRYPGGMDLLGTAIEAAHEAGLLFTAVYKPFEGGLTGMIGPHGMPVLEPDVVWRDLRGVAPVMRPFIAAHPEYCLSRQPGDEDPGGALVEIRLVKDDDGPVGLAAEDVTIRTSHTTGVFEPYDGPMEVSETVEWRPLFPLGRQCRIVTLTGLQIPEDQRYVEVSIGEGALTAPFVNEYAELVELVNADGEQIPNSTATVDPPLDVYVKQMRKAPYPQLLRYVQHPEVAAFLADDEAIAACTQDFCAFARIPSEREFALHERRKVAFARGKPKYLRGILNPVYPEVRREWLRTIQWIVDKGADTVDLRPTSHLNQQEVWTYGYNEPVMAKLGGVPSRAEVRRVISEAYTQFVTEARDLLHAHDRKLGLHLISSFLLPRDENRNSFVLDFLEADWRAWIELADTAVFRGAMGYRWETLRYVVDSFADACAEGGIPLIYQSNRRAFVNRLDALHLHPERLEALRYEWRYAQAHPRLSGFQLYETANFTRMDDEGHFEGSPQIEALVAEFGART